MTTTGQSALTAARPRPRPATRPAGDTVVTGHVRGSSLMLAGRLAAMLVAFVTQVLVVRHLTKNDYGVFAYALSAVLLLQSLLPLGMDRSDTRFLALYEERRDHGRLLGVIVLEAGTVLVLGTAAFVAALALRGSLADSLASGPRAYDVLLAMLALAPLQAVDILVVNVFAVFARPLSVFVRRYVLDPGLRLVAVLVVIATNGGVVALTLGYVVAGLIGLLIYVGLLVRLLRRRAFLSRLALRSLVLPVREVLGFSVPLLLTNFVAVAGMELGAVVLGHYRPASDVAAFRAVQPFAALNLVVMYSFTTLFTPAAARLYARDDRPGLRRLYWQSACWVAVLTLPVLCVTTALASPVTIAAFGDRYAGSAVYLALMSCGFYVNAALGFNGITVLMLGRLRYLTLGNLGVLAWMVGANLLLVPRWGTTGAVIATVSTALVHNVVKQAGLGFGAGIGVADREHAAVMGKIAVAVVAVNAVTLATHESPAGGAVVTTAVTVAVVRMVAPTLDLPGTFPELARVPVLRRLIGVSSAAA